MNRDSDETLSFSLLNRLVDDMLQRDFLDPAFGVEDVLPKEENPPLNSRILAELVRYHFAIHCDDSQRISLSEYLHKFPRHRCWEALLRETESLETQDISALRTMFTKLEAHDNIRSDSIPEFFDGPLSRLPFNLQAELRSLMFEESFGDRDILLAEGTIGDRLMVITSGLIQIESGLSGESVTILAAAGRGDVLGEMSLVGGRSCMATVTAQGPVTVLSLPAMEFHRLRSTYPPIAQVITEVVAARLGNEQRDALSFKSLNGYRISRRLGRGGMSVVYEAVHETTSLRVALKMMSHRLVYDNYSRELFDREAQTISAFEHPNIPRIHERFDDFGTKFMAIEFVQGIPLSAVIQKKLPLSARDLQAILGQLACALEHAHRSQIVHRDVKPANCMLRRDGIIKLMDFGLSVQMQQRGDPDGVIAGTLAYMAPEQLAGSAASPAADWFSLGLVIVELATGRRLLQPRQVTALADMYHDWQPDRIAAELECPVLREFIRRALQLDPQQRNVDTAELMALAAAISIERFADELEFSSL